MGKKKISLFITLFSLWVIFSGYFELFYLAAGAITSIIIALYFKFLFPYSLDGLSARKTVKTIKYFFWLIKEIFKSSLTVTKKIWQFKPAVSPAFSYVPTTSKDIFGVTVYANSITLTPGTVSVDVEKDQILVHALCKEDLEGLKNV
jgi:multicomponent Na+:H+ antiporter subunit E